MPQPAQPGPTASSAPRQPPRLRRAPRSPHGRQSGLVCPAEAVTPALSQPSTRRLEPHCRRSRNTTTCLTTHAPAGVNARPLSEPVRHGGVGHARDARKLPRLPSLVFPSGHTASDAKTCRLTGTADATQEPRPYRHAERSDRGEVWPRIATSRTGRGADCPTWRITAITSLDDALTTRRQIAARHIRVGRLGDGPVGAGRGQCPLSLDHDPGELVTVPLPPVRPRLLCLLTQPPPHATRMGAPPCDEPGENASGQHPSRKSQGPRTHRGITPDARSWSRHRLRPRASIRSLLSASPVAR